MFSPSYRDSIRPTAALTALLLASCITPASAWGQQASAADIARAKVKIAKERVALAEAELELLEAGGTASEASGPPLQKTAAASTTPKTTPELPRSNAASDTGSGQGSVREANASNGGKPNQPVAPVAPDAETKAKKEFGGLEFGVGISFTLDVGENDRITEAELVNGLVRVKDEDNGRARIMLESHYFFKPCQDKNGNEIAGCRLPFGLKAGDFGFGPFIALQPGTEEIIQAVAIGGMVGFRRPGEGTESFNLGLGVVIDPNTRILGDGIVANEPLPAGETAIRYKEKMQTGALLLASFGF